MGKPLDRDRRTFFKRQSNAAFQRRQKNNFARVPNSFAEPACQHVIHCGCEPRAQTVIRDQSFADTWKCDLEVVDHLAERAASSLDVAEAASELGKMGRQVDMGHCRGLPRTIETS